MGVFRVISQSWAMNFISISANMGALIIRIGFWGPLYYNCNKEPPKIVWVIMKAPILLEVPS